ncbi:MAG: ABC transporter ATP-binding protein [Gammaproteobacteria bacterium]|nr:ABC transporter ATP-binding protein [Gammaproteobacteria bacterium]
MASAISIQELHKTYANGHQALRGVDLEVQEQDFFALLGPNGAGKSTLIGIISTLVRQTSGNVSVFGKSVATHPYEAKLDFGIVPQEVNFSPFEKVADVVMTQAGYYGLHRSVARERTERYLRQLGLWDKRDNRSRMLSGGMKRRLMIARALVHEPRLLILDEPTAGVDIDLRRSMWDFLQEINKGGTTIVLTTHYLEEAESLCRNIAIFDDGRITECTSMKSLLNKLELQTFIFDTQYEIDMHVFRGSDIGHARILDTHSFEIDLKPGEDLSQIFTHLSRINILVKNVRSKTNRLEQFFLSRAKIS